MRDSAGEVAPRPGPTQAGSTSGAPCRILFVFLDGVGIGAKNPRSNPFFRARLPTLRALLNDEIPHLDQPESGTRFACAFPVDALLGVEGLPQSGTGQTALLTGENAPAIYGRHFGPWVPVRLRPLLAEKNVLSRAQALGLSCTFANAYPRDFHRTPWARRPAAPPLAAQAAGLLTLHQEALARGEAVSSEIVNTTWRKRLALPHLPEITPQEAGMNLAAISADADLTFFAHYTTDLAGHGGDMDRATAALERVDAFFDGLLSAVAPQTLVVVASDHGNIEDVTTGHTLNPTLGLLVGPGSARLSEGLTALTHVAPMILSLITPPE